MKHRIALWWKSEKTDKSQSASAEEGVSEVDGGSRGAGAEAGGDPKNVAELTHYIQSMLQQMQDRSDIQIVLSSLEKLGCQA